MGIIESRTGQEVRFVRPENISRVYVRYYLELDSSRWVSQSVKKMTCNNGLATWCFTR